MTDKQMEEFRPTISEHYDFHTIIENHRKLWEWIDWKKEMIYHWEI